MLPRLWICSASWLMGCLLSMSSEKYTINTDQSRASATAEMQLYVGQRQLLMPVGRATVHLFYEMVCRKAPDDSSGDSLSMGGQAVHGRATEVIARSKPIRF